MGWLANAANEAARVLFEPACVGCKQPLSTPLRRPLCDSCWDSIEPIAAPHCSICADELHGLAALGDCCERCLETRPAYSMARSAGRFEGALRETVHAFKFEGRRLLAEPLGTLLLSAGRDVLADTHAVVPVPLHPFRALRRGFNQADDLARQLKLPVWRVLKRRRQGPPQSSLPAAVRRRRLDAHFGLSFRATAPRPFGQPLAGARLVLIDDVMTTGATLDACARVLLDGGAAEVRALTAARAVAGRPPRPPAQPLPSEPPR